VYDFHNFGLSPIQELALNILILSVIIMSILRGEKRIEDSSPHAILALLALFAISGRILLDPIPNVQPVTVIILLVGIFYGIPWALALSGIIALSTNLVFLGHGPWTLFQVAGWGLVGIIGATLSNRLVLDGRLSVSRLMGVSVVSAFVFDWIVSLSILLNHEPSMLLPYLANGIVFDLYHAVGNLIFVAWIATPLSEIMQRHRLKASYRAVREVAIN
jgi:energy-coupling factor transport system substrate-specific component|tara:strand:- start:49 stop:702 length:654 start_codon:yes stop_codon:yes gene_type:complete